MLLPHGVFEDYHSEDALSEGAIRPTVIDNIHDSFTAEDHDRDRDDNSSLGGWDINEDAMQA